MIWVVVGLVTLLAFAHVGVRAAKLAPNGDAPPVPEDTAVPVIERKLFGPDRLTYQGELWFRDGYYWYHSSGEKAGDVWGINCAPRLRAAIVELRRAEMARKFR